MADKFGGFKFSGPRLEDPDLPRIGHEIGVGEDVIHAVMDVETAGSGTDSRGRLKMLYEPHVAYREAPTAAVRDKLVRAGLAYKSWGQKPYPKDSYPRLLKAMEIDETTALRAASWALPQILGSNFALAGYPTVQAMILDFLKDEDNQLEAMIEFVKNSGLGDELRVVEAKLRRGQRITPDDARPFVRGYNGAGYAKNDYHTKFARAANKWAKIPDTPWSPTGESGPTPVVVRPGAPGAATGDTPILEEVRQLERQPETADLYDGEYHSEIEALQRRLKALGYPEFGEVDGRWGTKTRAAMLAFRADNGLPLVPVIDEELSAALLVATPRYVNPGRAEATAEDLARKGAKDVKKARSTSFWAKIAAAMGLTGGVSEALDQVQGYGGVVRQVAEFLDPLKSFLQEYFWLVLLAGGVFVAWRASEIIKIRVQKHRTGEDVST